MLEKHKPGEFNPDLFRYPYDETKAAALFARFVGNNTWQVPTLTVVRAMAHLNVDRSTNDPRLKYMPPSLRKRWNPVNDFRLKLRRAGVKILAGTMR